MNVQSSHIESIHCLVTSGVVEKTSVFKMGPTISLSATAKKPLHASVSAVSLGPAQFVCKQHEHQLQAVRLSHFLGSLKSPGTMYKICSAMRRHPSFFTAGVSSVGFSGTPSTGCDASSPASTSMKKLRAAASSKF